jgi:serine/threonine protein kinase
MRIRLTLGCATLALLLATAYAAADATGGVIRSHRTGARYRVGTARAYGSWGAVYNGHVDGHPETRVAIKLLYKLPEGDAAEHQASANQWLLAEAGNLARVSHPVIPKLIDVGVLEGTERKGIVMELADGHGLDADGPQPPGKAVRLARRVLEGLGAIHDAGLFHRDVKRGNILWNGYNSPTARLVDLANARPIEDDPAGATGDVVALAQVMKETVASYGAVTRAVAGEQHWLAEVIDAAGAGHYDARQLQDALLPFSDGP